MKRLMFRVVFFVTLVFMTNLAGAQFEINWSTIDGGGAMKSTGDAFSLSSTFGQPDAQVAPVMSGGGFELTGGFWPVANVCYCLGDLNHDGRRDGQDVQQFVACILLGGDCACADVDSVGGITLSDVAVFVNDLLSGTACP